MFNYLFVCYFNNIALPLQGRVKDSGSFGAKIVALSPNLDDDQFRPIANGKGVQIMITKKMRRILVDELNYLETEVDDMEPQVRDQRFKRSHQASKFDCDNTFTDCICFD